MKYTTPGLVPGILIALAGLIITVGILFCKKKKSTNVTENENASKVHGIYQLIFITLFVGILFVIYLLPLIINKFY